jgi:hypothetical protein
MGQSYKMADDPVLKITPGMSEEEILEACAEVVLENTPDDIQKRLDETAAQRGFSSVLALIKASLEEDRAKYDTLEDWLAVLPGRLN